MPFISIIVAAFNAQDTIVRCLESCVQQTFNNFEVILVDDGATDRTASLAQSYVQQDPRFYLIQTPNAGQGYARNLGIDAARGDYITILDADDTLDPTALETLAAAATLHDADLVIANWRRQQTQTDTVQNTPIFPSEIQGLITKEQKSYALARTYFSVAKLYRKAMLQTHDIRYGEGYIYEDMPFVVGAVVHAKHTAVVANPLYTVYISSTSSTQSQTQGDWHARSFEKAVRATLHQYHDQLSPYRKQYTFYVLNRAYVYAMQDRRVPKPLWRQFVHNIFEMISSLYPDTPRPDTASRRYALILRIWAWHKETGYLAFRLSTYLARRI